MTQFESLMKSCEKAFDLEIKDAYDRGAIDTRRKIYDYISQLGEDARKKDQRAVWDALNELQKKVFPDRLGGVVRV